MRSVVNTEYGITEGRSGLSQLTVSPPYPQQFVDHHRVVRITAEVVNGGRQIAKFTLGIISPVPGARDPCIGDKADRSVKCSGKHTEAERITQFICKQSNAGIMRGQVWNCLQPGFRFTAKSRHPPVLPDGKESAVPEKAYGKPN